MNIVIDGEEFEVLDEIEHVTLADSFVFIKMKATTGHGEARLYVGPQKVAGKFFSSFDMKCFFLKSDFESYMNDARTEYKKQEQGYRENIAEKWDGFMEEIEMMNRNKFYFYVKNAIGKQDPNRFYIRSEDSMYTFMRRIALPQISYITILKIKSKNGEQFYYFRLFLDYYYSPTEHPSVISEQVKKIENEKIPITEKLQLIKARFGQGNFRDGVMKDMPMCLITEVTDERILIASHIKPWAVSEPKERLDPKNGLPLTPTYDKLFNEGFISFEDDGTILVSPYISPLNIKKLSLIPNKKYTLPKDRQKYLKYHRENLFKK